MKVSTILTSSLFLLASSTFAYQDLATRGEDLVAKGEYLIARGEYLIARANKKAAPAKKGNKSGHLGGAESGTCVVQAKGAGPGFCNLNTGHRVACEANAKCTPAKKGCGWVPGSQRAQCGLEAGRLGH
ncbi:unnamed protein product [Clonostachys byssicola]|uniref:Uncharacterized protein n=1 Tax=Clonostachys byssicola TaxID=160290 RepID=A0A9N9XWK3_9HYPO|nr:unnamed protein product [Clonostachys byssicola]